MQIIKHILLVAAVNTACLSAANGAQQSREIDRALVNEGRLAQWLEQHNNKYGRQDEKFNDAVDAYITRYQKNNQRSLSKFERHVSEAPLIVKGKRLSTQAPNYQANVLAVLIDFPDLTATTPQISSAHTDMYYDDYSKSHYEEMLFSNTGFTGPNGESFQSVAQYFSQESGNSFDFDGEFAGWVRADNNADFYGTNEGSSDKRVETLVVEAVTKAVAAGVDLSDFDANSDGVVDHLLIFHSSIGEEAGGGVLGEDAIWSHSYSVVNANGGQPQSIVGSNIKIANYTIQPIDSAPGVVAHEFGHDLGLYDEYDLNDISVGAPVQEWSIMSGGSWVGAVSGTQPSTFSPLAREQLQNSIGGNWINQSVIDSASLDDTVQRFEIVSATTHDTGINQLKISLPPTTTPFITPRSGQYHYYSGKTSDTRAALTFDASLPSSTALSLSMYAQWDIEIDYDYVQLLVNGVPQANTQTAMSSGAIPGVSNYITGASEQNVWQSLNFDLNAFSGQDVTIELIYVTDPAINEFGIVVDDITIVDGQAVIFSDTGEGTTNSVLTHFTKITKDLPLEPVSYYVQYRPLTSLDAGLTHRSYEPGLLLWLGDENYLDNNSSEHPGHGFIAVVDADQNRIGNRDTNVQLRDATFSLFAQQAYSQDQHLEARPTFKDSDDYSSPIQPRAGVVLPVHNIEFEVVEQTDQSVIIELTKPDLTLGIDFDFSINDKTINAESSVEYAQGDVTYAWTFGDGSSSQEQNPSHTYANYGVYDLALVVEDGSGEQATLSQQITVAPSLSFNVAVDSAGMVAAATVDIESGASPFTLLVTYSDGEEEQQTLASVGSVDLQHTFSLSGEYDIEVSVTDSVGQHVSSGEKVTIDSGLSASFSHTVDDLTVNLVEAVVSGLGNKSLSWDFGDGTTSTQTSPTHVYSTAGTYSITLQVTDESQLTVSQTTTLTVSESAVTTDTSTTTTTSDSGGSGGSLTWLLLIGFAGTMRSGVNKATRWLNIKR